MEETKKIKKRKIISLLTLIVMIFNMVVPNTALAVYTENGQAKYNVLRISDITKKSSGNYVFYVEYGIIGDAYAGSFDISLKYDTTLFGTARKDTGAANTSIARITETNSDLFTFQVKEIPSGAGTIRMMGTTTDWWNPVNDGDESDDYGNEISVFKVYFYLKDPTAWKLDGSKEITSDMISWLPTNSLKTGYKQRVADDENGTNPKYLQDLSYLATSGFAEATKSVTSIAVKTNPTKTSYEHGDSIDLTGGVITATYDDGTTEDVDMTDSKVTITSGSTADVNSPTVTVKYSGQTVSFPITVTDPVQSLAVTSPMTTVEYNHDDTLDFTGLQLTATKKSGATVALTQSSTGVTTSETKASVNSSNFTQTSAAGDVPVKGTQKIIFTYEGKTATQTIIVNDGVSSISLTSQPTKTVYKYGESLDLTGAVVKVTLGSGATTNINLPDGSITVGTFSNTTTGSKQNLSVALGDKTASETINVEVYDYVTSSTLVTPTKTDYNYGESLSVTGGKLRLVKKSNATQDVTLTTDMVSGYNSHTVGTQTLTVTYVPKYTLSDSQVITGETITKTYAIELYDEPTAIQVQNAPTEANYGNELNLTNTTLAVTRRSGSSTVNVTSDMLSGYDKNTVSTQTVTVTYEGQTTTFSVEVKDYVSDITLTNPTKTAYTYGESLDLTGGQVQKVMASGAATNAVALTDASVTVSTPNMNQAGTQAVTVTYAGKTKTFDITVTDEIASIAVKTNPTKTTYGYNESLDLTGGTIEVTKQSGAKSTVSMTDSAVTTTEVGGSALDLTNVTFGSDNKATKQVQINYAGKTATLPVTIINKVTGITMHTTPKTSYNVNDSLDVTNGEILVTRQTGTPEVKAITTSMVSGFTSATENTSLPLTVSYTENGETKTTTYTVSVKDSVTAIQVQNAPTEAKYGEELDLTNTKIKVTKGSGTTTIPVTTSMLTGYNKNTLGSQTVTVTYGGKTDTFSVEVKDYVSDITLTAPTKTAYTYGESLDLTGGKVQKVMASGAATNAVALTDASVTVSTPNMNQVGTQAVTVTYAGKTKTFNITVTDEIASIAVKTNPTKTTYGYNESLNLAGGEIEVTKQSGAKTTVSMTDSAVTTTEVGGSALDLTNVTFGTDNKATKQVQINYAGKTTTLPVTIVNKVTGITMHTTPKTSYNVNDSLDVTNGEILVTRQTGTPEVKAITTSMVSGFTSATENTSLPLTVSYTENGETKTTTYNVSVTDSVTAIQVQNAPTEANYGEELDLTNTKIKVTKGSGTTTIPVTTSMLTGYNKNTLGSQTVTVTYGGKTDTFSVEVKDYVSDITLTAPTKTAYTYGESLDLTGGKVQKVMASGAATTPVALTDASVTVSTPNMNQAGTQAVTVTYAGKTKSFNITITDEIASIAVKTNPTKTTYGYNESLNLAGGEIEVTKQSGAKSTVSMTDSAVTTTEVGGSALDLTNVTFGTDNKASKQVQINYAGKTATLPITIVNKVTGITMHTTPKTSYNVNDSLDVTNGEILVTRQTGTPEVKSITTSMVSGFTSATENTSLPLTVTYTENGETKTTTYNVSVTDSVTAIQVQNAPTEANYGEELDLTNTKIKITKGSGTTTIPVTSSMLSGYDKNTLGSQTVTVTYGGKTDKFSVEVKDYVSDITLTNPTKTAYTYGESLDLTGGKVQKVMASGAATTPVALTDASVTVSTPNMNQVGTQAVTVTYAGKTKSFNITITDEIASIAVKTNPTKTTYGYNESLNLAGGEIEVTKQSGAKSTVSMTDSAVTTTEVGGGSLDLTNVTFGSDNKATKQVQINYAGKTATLPVTIINKVTGITMHTTPKTSYNVNDSLDVTNGEILVTRQTGTPEVKSITTSMVSGFTSATENTSMPLTVSYTENGETKTTTYNVSVTDSVTAIQVQNAPTEANYGEELDLTNTKIKITKGSGTTTIPVTSSMLSGYDKNTLGSQTVTVTYGGKTDTFSVEVKDYVSDITLTNPTKTAYTYGESLDLTGGKVQKVMASGAATNAVALTDASVTVSTPDMTQIGTQTVTVTYAGKTKTFDITVTDNVNSIKVNNAPSTSDYGKDLDLTQTTITVVKDSNPAGITIPVTKEMISNFNKNTLGAQQVTVTYAGKTDTFDVTVNDYVVDFVLTAPSKTSYEYGEELDLSDAVITKVTASGDNTQTIPVENSMVTGYDSHKLGAQTITVTYAGKTKTFGIEVKDSIKSIEITTTPKTSYKYGENLDITGGKIKVTRSSGTTTQNITSSMVSGYNPNKLGAQTVTVTYQGKATTYTVNVEDYVKDIKITKPEKLVYNLNEKLDLTGAKVSVEMASGAIRETVPMSENMITGFDTTKVGAKNLVVTYAGKTANFGINVVDPLAKVKIHALPIKTNYKYGEKMDLTGGSIEAIRNSGAKEIIPMEESMISGFTTNKLGQILVNVNYQGMKDSFYINVEDYEKETKLVPPTKKDYEYGESLDLTNGSIKTIMASGKEKQVKLDPSMVSGFDNKKTGTQTLTVNYGEFTQIFDITLKDSLGGIALNSAPNKTKYNEGDSLDLTGATIKAIRTSGTKVMNITKEMVSGYNPNVSGYQVVTVTYEGKTTDFVVYVYPKVAPSTEDNTKTTDNNKTTNTYVKPTNKNTKVPQIKIKRNGNKPSAIKAQNDEATKEAQNNDEKVESNTTTEDVNAQEKAKDTTENNVKANEGTTSETKNAEKPTVTLGERDYNDSAITAIQKEKLAEILLPLALIMLLALLISRKNTKIYVEEDKEFALGGKVKLSNKNLYINVNDYLDGETYKGKVKIVLDDNISKKLDGKELSIKHRDKETKLKLKYEDKPIEIILK